MWICELKVVCVRCLYFQRLGMRKECVSYKVIADELGHREVFDYVER